MISEKIFKKIKRSLNTKTEKRIPEHQNDFRQICFSLTVSNRWRPRLIFEMAIAPNTSSFYSIKKNIDQCDGKKLKAYRSKFEIGNIYYLKSLSPFELPLVGIWLPFYSVYDGLQVESRHLNMNIFPKFGHLTNMLPVVLLKRYQLKKGVCVSYILPSENHPRKYLKKKNPNLFLSQIKCLSKRIAVVTLLTLEFLISNNIADTGECTLLSPVASWYLGRG